MAWRIPSSIVIAAISVVLASRGDVFLFPRAPRGKLDPSVRDQTERATQRPPRPKFFLRRAFLRPGWRTASGGVWGVGLAEQASRRFLVPAAIASLPRPLSFPRQHPDRANQRT